MRYFIFSLLMLGIAFTSLGQEGKNVPSSLFGNSKLFSHAEFSNLIFDIGYLNGTVLNKNLNGVNVNLLVAFNHHFATGFSMDNLSTNSIILPDKISAINPQFNFSTFNWRNEILIGANHKIGISIPVDVGIGYVSYTDQYYQTYNNSRTIADDHFFSAAAGLNMNINLFRHAALSLGGRYRIASGVTKVGADPDYSNYVLNATVRFSIYKEDFDDGHHK